VSEGGGVSERVEGSGGLDDDEEQEAWHLAGLVCPGPAEELHCIAVRAVEACDSVIGAGGVAATSHVAARTEGRRVRVQWGRRWVLQLLELGVCEATWIGSGDVSSDAWRDVLVNARRSAVGPSMGAAWERVQALQKDAVGRLLSRSGVIGAGRVGPCARLVQDAWAMFGAPNDDVGRAAEAAIRSAFCRPSSKA